MTSIELLRSFYLEMMCCIVIFVEVFQILISSAEVSGEVAGVTSLDTSIVCPWQGQGKLPTGKLLSSESTKGARII